MFTIQGEAKIRKVFEKIKSEYNFENSVSVYNFFNQSEEPKMKEFLINELNNLFDYFIKVNISDDIKEVCGGYCWHIGIDSNYFFYVDFVPQSISDVIKGDL